MLMYFLEVLMRQLFAKTLDTSPLEDNNMSVIVGWSSCEFL